MPFMCRTTFHLWRAISKYIKETEAPCKVVFIGPCTAKKAEVQKDAVKPYVDAAMTFEELQALFDSRDIDITTLSKRMFSTTLPTSAEFSPAAAVLSDAVAEGLKEHGIEDFELRACACDGIEACRAALLKKSQGSA